MATNLQSTNAQQNEFNLTDDLYKLGHTVPKLFGLVSSRYSDKTAIVCGDKDITYGKLASDSDLVAHTLTSRGIGAGHTVGVAVERSIELIVIMLGVIKAGAAYIPIDPALPAERVSQMLDDDALRMVVMDNSATRKYTCGNEVVCCTVKELDELAMTAEDGITAIRRQIRPDDLAYILYTSGSTGKPKGVQVHHEALCNYILSVQERPGCTHRDRVLAKSTISFDMAVWEIYPALLCGATLILAQAHEIKDARALHSLIERHHVTTSFATPTTWQMLLDIGWTGTPSLTTLLVGGEALTPRLATQLVSCAADVWNIYGPTETTVSVAAWRVESGKTILLGTPNHNTRLYVLDETLEPVSVGNTGELYISGAGVAQGYRNDGPRTEAAFLVDPFRQGSNMYRTGDLACFVEPGKLSVLGRADSQIKIRGQRLEPGDIEAAITAHEAIANAVVIARDNRLVAYCVSKQNPSEMNTGTASIYTGIPVASFLRPWLEGRLPAYMVPSFFVEIQQLPMTINGKIDLRALPDPISKIGSEKLPETALAQELVSIWSQVLGHSQIGVNDNFFHIGGDSGRVIRMQAEIEKFLGRPVLTAKLYEHYTIKELAVYLSGAGEQESSSKEDLARPLSGAKNEHIAVISMACRLPGNINTPEDLWQVLINDRDVITEVPKDRWDADAFYDSDPDASGKSYSTGGGFVESATSFDAAFFGISPREARAMDPAQSMILETCWEGFERAGYGAKSLSGTQTGVFIGAGNSLLDDGHLSSHGMESLAGHVGLGTAPSALSGRISYALDLEGPSITVDSGCAASLVATHLACSALRQGECNMAVAGGVTFLPSPGLHIEFSRLRVASPDGRSRPFSADADGMGLAEGASVVILKRLSDAQRDGDEIHAVIRGSSVNHGGRGPSLTAPSGKGQKQMLRAAVAAAGLNPHDIDYVEAHGTGTKQGDPIEGTAIAEVFGGSRSATSGPLRLGSSKSNIGHTQAAAGVTGLIKVALAMRHSVLPKTLHSAKLNPLIDWKGSNMKICQSSSPWLARDSETPRRAGVNSFGIAGTSAHVVIEEPPKQQRIAGLERSHSVMPFLISAYTRPALLQQADKLSSFLDRADVQLHDVAFSLATTRTHFPQRQVVMAKNKKELQSKLKTIAENLALNTSVNSKSRGLAMLFSGQGSQWPGMGKTLAEEYAVFRNSVQEIAGHFRPFLEHSLLDVMWADSGSESAMLLQRTDYAQPAIFTLQVALWQLWTSWGVRPDVVLGHSVGELTAAHVAGVMNLADACRLVAERGRLMHSLPATGGMLAIEAAAEEAKAALKQLSLGDNICVAGINTPTQVVMSGNKDELEDLAAHFRNQGRMVKHLQTSAAFHSHHLKDEMLAGLREAAESTTFSRQTVAIVSTLTGKIAEAGELSIPDYWVRQARLPVQFVDAIQSLAAQGFKTFVELGPSSVLCGMGAECIDDAPAAASRGTNVSWLPSLNPKSPDSSTILNSLSELHIRQVDIDWDGYFSGLDCHRVELPTYAFQRQRHWLSGLSSSTSSKSLSSSSLPFSSVNSRSGDSLSSLVSLDGFSSVESLESVKEVSVRPQSQVQIGWHAIDVGTGAKNSTWGLLCPTRDGVWVAQVKEALSHSGQRPLPITSLGEAEAMGGAICLWDTDDENGGKEMIARATLQLRAAADMGFSGTLVWITRGVIDGGIDETSLWGMMRGARIRYPQLRLRIVDFGDQVDLAAASMLVSIILLRNEPECIVRGGRVLVPWMQLDNKPCMSVATGISRRHPRTQKRDLQVDAVKTDKSLASTTDTLMEKLREAAKEERELMLQALVRGSTAQALGMANPDDVDMYRSLEDAGIDSLGAIQLRKLLGAQIGILLPPNFKTAHNNLMAVCAGLGQQLEQMWSNNSSVV